MTTKKTDKTATENPAEWVTGNDGSGFRFSPFQSRKWLSRGR